MKKILVLCFILAVVLRVYSVFPYNTIMGFDQARDLFDAYTMVQTHHPRIIGPTAGNNPNLHHGIAFIYYLAVPIAFFGPNPMNAVYFNILVQSSLVFILAYFSWELFKNKAVAITTAIMTAFSYNLIQFAGWLSNPTVTLVTVPIFYLALWQYRKNERWLMVAAVALGASIEFELFFIYLVPVFVLFWLLFRPKIPKLTTAVASLLLFMATTSTMIVTEIKYSFSGVLDIVTAGSKVGGGLPFLKRLTFFSTQLAEQLSLSLGSVFPVLLVILLCVVVFVRTKAKTTRASLLFLYLYIASPALMLFLGAHNAPWFLIGIPPAIIMLYAYLFSQAKLPGYLVLSVILAIGFFKTTASVHDGQSLLEPDQSALLSRQIAAIEYTYKNANTNAFAIDTVTNPLYINAVWAYNYLWYGQREYGYQPYWLGGDQLPPYNTLTNTDGRESILFLFADTTSRIPEVYREKAVKSLEEKGDIVDTRLFNEIKVVQFRRKIGTKK